MSYLTNLDIKEFKGLKNLELKGISNINLIVGNNNTGKTSILEAITLLQSQNDINTILKHIYRGESNYPSKFDLFLEIFPKEQKSQKNIQINSTINNVNRSLFINGNLREDEFKGKMSIELESKIIGEDIQLKLNQNNKSKGLYDIIKIVYITPYDYFKDGLITNVIKNISKEEKEKIIKLLNIFDKNILDFEIVKTQNKSNPVSTYIKHKKYGIMPIFSFGDSIKKVLTLATAIICAKEGILLVDEIETAIHKSMIDEVFKWFIQYCKEYKVQAICTTHSLEVIDSMIISIKNDIDVLSCFRIETYEDGIYSTKFSGNKLKDIRTLLGQDVR